MARIDGRFHEVTPWSGVYDRFTAYYAVEEDAAEAEVLFDASKADEDDPRQNELAADSDPALGRPRFEVEPA